MAIVRVQSNEGVAATATVNPSFSVAPTTGNLVVLAFASDDYNGTPDTGWTQSTGMEQGPPSFFHGAYIWWRISDGSNPPGSYTIASASNSAWILVEYSGADSSPYDISNGTINNSSGTTQASPTITPTAGDRVMLATFGGSAASDLSAQTGTFSNSFSTIRDVGDSAGATRDWVALGERLLTADGTTGITTTGSTTPITLQSRSSLIISFKAAVAAAAAAGDPSISIFTDSEIYQVQSRTLIY